MNHRIHGFAMTACLGTIIGCTASASVAPAPSSPPPGCGEDSSLSCSQGNGWSCPAGDNPENEQSNLSCSVPTADGPNDEFCCFAWTHGTTTCTPDDELTSVCQPGSYGYRCQAGDDPTSLDSSLNCSNSTPDGSDDDFCCN